MAILGFFFLSIIAIALCMIFMHVGFITAVITYFKAIIILDIAICVIGWFIIMIALIINPNKSKKSTK